MKLEELTTLAKRVEAIRALITQLDNDERVVDGARPGPVQIYVGEYWQTINVDGALAFFRERIREQRGELRSELRRIEEEIR